MEVCFNKDCPIKKFNDKSFLHTLNNGKDVLIEPSDNHCELFGDVTECEYFTDVIPIHDECGLPVELCECPDARVKFIDGSFVDTKPPAKGKG